MLSASPVVADAAVRTEADRHRAALMLSESPAARDSTSGTIAMLRARLPLQETQRRLVLSELRYLEMSRDLDRAEELIALLGDSAESDLQVAARSAMGRICIARGRGLPVDGVPLSQGATQLADAVVRLAGIDATAATRLGRAGPLGIS